MIHRMVSVGGKHDILSYARTVQWSPSDASHWFLLVHIIDTDVIRLVSGESIIYADSSITTARRYVLIVGIELNTVCNRFDLSKSVLMDNLDFRVLHTL